MTPKLTRQSGTWPNAVTAEFWAGLAADPKCLKYWTRYAEADYRRSLRDEPMPGIWPKYCARIQVGMAIFQALEEKQKGVPAGFLGGAADPDIRDVDCYGIAEILLDDEMVRKLGGGPARTEKKVRKKRVGRRPKNEG